MSPEIILSFSLFDPRLRYRSQVPRDLYVHAAEEEAWLPPTQKQLDSVNIGLVQKQKLTLGKKVSFCVLNFSLGLEWYAGQSLEFS